MELETKSGNGIGRNLRKRVLQARKLDILERINHSEWAAPVVVVPKGDGALRVCGDYKVTINPALVLHKYSLLRPYEISKWSEVFETLLESSISTN